MRKKEGPKDWGDGSAGEVLAAKPEDLFGSLAPAHKAGHSGRCLQLRARKTGSLEFAGQLLQPNEVLVSVGDLALPKERKKKKKRKTSDVSDVDL